MAARKEKENSINFQSVLSSLLAHNYLPSIEWEGIAQPSLDSSQGSLGSEKIIDDVV